MKKSGKIITKDMFKKNIESKLMEHSFIDDIGPLLSPSLRKTHSKNLVTSNGSFLVTESGNRVTTSGWSLTDAAEEIKTKILMHLPN